MLDLKIWAHDSLTDLELLRSVILTGYASWNSDASGAELVQSTSHKSFQTPSCMLTPGFEGFTKFWLTCEIPSAQIGNGILVEIVQNCSLWWLGGAKSLQSTSHKIFQAFSGMLTPGFKGITKYWRTWEIRSAQIGNASGHFSNDFYDLCVSKLLRIGTARQPTMTKNQTDLERAIRDKGTQNFVRRG